MAAVSRDILCMAAGLSVSTLRQVAVTIKVWSGKASTPMWLNAQQKTLQRAAQYMPLCQLLLWDAGQSA